MLISLAMLLLGLLLGFMGAGGAGLMIAVLTLLFDIPIHTALGTSLGAMMLITVSGIASHHREGNVEWRTGLPIGIWGAAGAFCGARLAALLGGAHLAQYTGITMCCFSLIIYVRVFHPTFPLLHCKLWDKRPQGITFWITAGATGVVTGMLSGFFGVGSTPLIQLALLLIFQTSLYHTVGTTMLVILPIATLGSLGYLIEGHFDGMLLAQVVVGQMVGVYVGAKFTRLAPPVLLKITMALLPALGGISLLLFSR